MPPSVLVPRGLNKRLTFSVGVPPSSEAWTDPDSAVAAATAAAAVRAFAAIAASVVGDAVPSAASCLDRHACFRVADLPFPDVAGVFGDLSIPARTTCLVVFDISGPASRFLSLEARAAHVAAAHSDASLE